MFGCCLCGANMRPCHAIGRRSILRGLDSIVGSQYIKFCTYFSMRFFCRRPHADDSGAGLPEVDKNKKFAGVKMQKKFFLLKLYIFKYFYTLYFIVHFCMYK